MRKNTRSWKHNGTHTRKVWGTAKENKRLTPFMLDDADIEIWEMEMNYGNCDDGISETED